MSDNGRLIINDRGETVQVVPAAPDRRNRIRAVDVNIQVHADRVWGRSWTGSGPISVSLTLNRNETLALICKLGDALGVGVEIGT